MSNQELPDNTDTRYAHLSFTVTTKEEFLELLRQVTELSELSASDIVRRCEAAGKREFSRQTAYNIGGGKNFPVAKNVRAYLTACAVPPPQVEEALASRTAIVEKEQAERRKRTQRPGQNQEPVEAVSSENVDPTLPESLGGGALAPPLPQRIPARTWIPSTSFSSFSSADTGGLDAAFAHAAPTPTPSEVEIREPADALSEPISPENSPAARPLLPDLGGGFAAGRFEDPALVDTLPLFPAAALRAEARRRGQELGSKRGGRALHRYELGTRRSRRVMLVLKILGCITGVLGAAASFDSTPAGQALRWQFWFFIVGVAFFMLSERMVKAGVRLFSRRRPGSDKDFAIEDLPRTTPVKWPVRPVEEDKSGSGWRSVALLAVAKLAPLPLLSMMIPARRPDRQRRRRLPNNPSPKSLALVDRTDLIPPRSRPRSTQLYGRESID